MRAPRKRETVKWQKELVLVDHVKVPKEDCLHFHKSGTKIGTKKRHSFYQPRLVKVFVCDFRPTLCEE